MKPLKYSRQRESIKACLMNRCDHPTADMIYESIQKEFPHVSLGTVYRNLNLLVEIGEIRKLSLGGGKDHFDANMEPHYHFICGSCGAIIDVPLPAFENLEPAAEPFVDGEITGHTVAFYGTCLSCLAARENGLS